MAEEAKRITAYRELCCTAKARCFRSRYITRGGGGGSLTLHTLNKFHVPDEQPALLGCAALVYKTLIPRQGAQPGPFAHSPPGPSPSTTSGPGRLQRGGLRLRRGGDRGKQQQQQHGSGGETAAPSALPLFLCLSSPAALPLQPPYLDAAGERRAAAAQEQGHGRQRGRHLTPPGSGKRPLRMHGAGRGARGCPTARSVPGA